MRILLSTILSCSALAMAVPAMADTQAAAAHNEDQAALASVLADAHRDKDRARDQYRHPAETLAFFHVAPGDTVAEYAPGGGWYTRVLAPYVAKRGKYIALNFAGGGTVPERYVERAASFSQTFPAKVEEMSGVPAADISAYLTTQAPKSINGTVDRILIFRMLHNMVRWGIADTELMAMRAMLKDDGLVGVVQHMAPEGMAYGKSDGNRGYLKKSSVIALMKLYGFELAGESFINANPKDTADHQRGVWTLPPVMALGDKEREKYTAICESNRMTLLFKKAR